MKNKRNRRASLLLAVFVVLGLLSCGMALGADPVMVSQFKDVANDNGNLVFINYLGARGIMNGFADGTFHPAEGLTRAQAAVIIGKAVGLSINNEGNSEFKDVPGKHWAAGYIASAVKAGYLKGFADGRYRPDEPLTRAQGISLIMRLSKEKDSGAPLPQLSDMASNHWAARAMAMALDAGMIATPANNAIQPDNPMSRGDISRALAVLLVNDPQLSSRKLTGTLSVQRGEVTLSQGGQTGKSVSGTVQVGVGDTIETGSNTEAVINYPDGSSLLLKEGTIFTIKQSLGRAYIKWDGKPGTAVDDLEVDLKVGKLFGGLSSLAQPVKTAAENPATKTSLNSGSAKLLASTAGKYDLLAAQEEPGTPWYKTAEKQKVKVKVDMPWGIAAIRGSFWGNSVNSNGSGSTNLLEGSAQVIAGGQTVSLSPGEASGASSAGAPPSAPTPMTAQQAAEWTQVQSWVTSTAATMTSNQGAPPADVAPAQTPGTPAPNPVATISQALSQALNQALSQATAAAASISSSTSSNSGSSSGGGSTPVCTMSATKSVYYLPNVFPGPVAGNIAFPLAVTPATGASVTWSESGTDVVDVSSSGTVPNLYIILTAKQDTSGFRSGKETLTLTVSASGYTPVSRTVDIYALPPLGVSCSSIGSSTPLPVALSVYDNLTTNLWQASDSMSLQFIQAGCNDSVTDTSGNALSTITPVVTDDSLSFSLNSALPVNQYEYVIFKAGVPVAIAPLLVSTLTNITVSGTLTDTAYIALSIPDPLGGTPLSGDRTFGAIINPANAAITYSPGSHIQITESGSGTSSRSFLLHPLATGSDTITFTANASGYTPLSKTVTFYVLPGLPLMPYYLPAGYSSTVSAYVYDPSTSLWVNGENLSMQLLGAGTGTDYGSYISNRVVGENSYSFDIATGLTAGQYVIVIKNASGAPIALSMLTVGAGNGTITLSKTVPTDTYLALTVPNPAGGIPSPGERTFVYGIGPPNAVLTYPTSSKVSFSETGAGTSTRTVTVTSSALGSEQLTFTATANGYDTLVKTVNFHVLPGLPCMNYYAMAGYASSVAVDVYDDTISNALWTASDTLYMSFYNAESGTNCNSYVSGGAVAENDYSFTVSTGLPTGKYIILLSKLNGATYVPTALSAFTVGTTPATLVTAGSASVDSTIVMPLIYTDPGWLSAAKSGATVTIDSQPYTSPTSVWGIDDSSGVPLLYLNPSADSYSKLTTPGPKAITISVNGYSPVTGTKTLIAGFARQYYCAFSPSLGQSMSSAATATISLFDIYGNPCTTGSASGTVNVLADISVPNAYTPSSEAVSINGGTAIGCYTSNVALTTCTGGVGTASVQIMGPVDVNDGFSGILWIDSNNSTYHETPETLNPRSASSAFGYTRIN